MNGIKAKFFVIALLLAVMAVGMILPAFPHITARAEGNAYSSVVDDLAKDKTFHAGTYPAKKRDYSLQVIQIAESTGGEVLVYVYQPCAMTKQLKATTINISTAIGENLSYKNYKLEYLNGSGVFAKYKVNELSVKADTVRYYDISSIFRAWEAEIDSPAAGATANGNTVSEVSYPVGKLYTASTLNGKVTYSVLGTETITVTDKYCGFQRYYEGFNLFHNSCDSWFVAFSTDKKVEKLMEADVYYVTQQYQEDRFGYLFYGDKSENYVALKYTERASNNVVGLFGHEYTWNRIESVKDFIENEELNEETKKGLQNKQWVLRFVETDYTGNGNLSAPLNKGTWVNEVTILRLKFETNGKVYNLGVVDNKQSAGLIPDNERGDGWEWWQILLIVIAVILVLVLLCIFIKPFAEIMLLLLKGILFIVLLPFRAIGALFKAIGKKKGKRK